MWLFLSCVVQNTDDTQKEVWDSSILEPSQPDSSIASEPSSIDTGEWPSDPWVVIGGGVWHTCAVDQNKQTHCWGRNLEGQSEPPQDVPFREVTGGRLFSCGLSFDSFVHCWGDYSFTVPQERFLSISAGKDFLCGIVEDQSILCAGFSHDPPVGTFTQIDAGNGHVCAVNTVRKVECFGDNASGQCSSPDDSFDIVQAGFFHSCAQNSDGVQCWGSAQDGATNVPIAQGVGLWTGNYHNCILNSNQQAVCWGGESFDLDGGIVGARFRALHLGGFHTCGLTLEDGIFCDGENTQGQTEVPVD
ncbi:MAG: hypothetical protein CL916_14830 [Deltaproteobacteria bacterium]|nr:hypothetical protein [Deltaproteobacteria bacterium]